MREIVRLEIKIILEYMNSFGITVSVKGLKMIMDAISYNIDQII